MAPKHGTRPTSDRVRESIFARLDVEDADVLDLYAGTGALGIEAVSRGAASATFVELAAGSLGALRDNVDRLLSTGQARIVAGDVVAAVARLGSENCRFDLVLVDPPYAAGELPRALKALSDAGLVSPGGLLVVESGRGHAVEEAPGFARLDERRYGDTLISRFTATGARPESPASASTLNQPLRSRSETTRQ